jgi:hypothetical protein
MEKVDVELGELRREKGDEVDSEEGLQIIQLDSFH